MQISALLEISAADPLDFAPIIFGIVAVAALIGALVGFWRGVAKQAVKLAELLVSILAAYGLSVIIFNRIRDSLADKSVAEVEQLISKFGINLDFSYFYELDPETSALAFAVPIALILLPLLFVPLYIISNSILHLLYKLICYLCGFRSDRNSGKTRIWGALLGVVSSLVFTGVIFTPVVGLSEITRESVALAKEEDPDEGFTSKLDDKYTAYAESVAESKIIRIYEKLGIGALYERIATVEIDGEKKNMTDLTPDIAKLISNAANLKGSDPKHLTDEDEERIKAMITVFEQNPYLADILAGAVRSTAISYENGSFPHSAPDPYDTLIISALEIFKTADSESITTDLDILSDAYFILSENGVLSAFDDGSEIMLEAMTKTDSDGKTTANRVIDLLRSNERTSSLVTLITKLSITVMNNGTGIGADAADTYESVKEKINTNLVAVNRSDYETQEEYTEKISDELGILLSENNIELDEEIIFGMAEYYTENFSDTTEVTDEMVSDIIFSYYDVYLEYTSKQSE